MVLEAAFNYEGIDPITRYYTVAVANDDVKTVNNKTLNGITRTEDGILRNMQYNVSLTVKGPGYETPFGPSVADNTFLDVKVEVVEFGQVNQESTIE